MNQLASYDPNKVKALPRFPLSVSSGAVVALAVAVILGLVLTLVSAMSRKKVSGEKTGFGSMYLAVVLDAGGAMFFLPFQAVFSVLLGCTGFQTSLASGAFAFTQFIGTIIIGSLTDKIETRKILLVTLFGCSICYFFAALTTLLPRQCFMTGMTTWHCEPYSVTGRFEGKQIPGSFNPAFLAFLGSRALAGFFASTVSVIETYIARLSTDEDRTGNVAQVMAYFGIGTLGGPVLAGFLYDLGFATLFLVAGSVTMVNVLYAYLTMQASAGQPSSTSKDEDMTEEARRPFKLALQTLWRVPFTLILLLGAFLTTSGMAMFMASSGLFCAEVYGWGGLQYALSTTFAGGIMAVMLMFAAGPISQALGDTVCIIVGSCVRTVGILGMVLIYSPITPWATTPIFAASGALLDAPLQSLLTRFSPTESLGTMVGFMQALRSLGEAVAPPISGLLIDLDLQYPFFAAATVTICCVLNFVPHVSSTKGPPFPGI